MKTHSWWRPEGTIVGTYNNQDEYAVSNTKLMNVVGYHNGYIGFCLSAPQRHVAGMLLIKKNSLSSVKIYLSNHNFEIWMDSSIFFFFDQWEAAEKRLHFLSLADDQHLKTERSKQYKIWMFSLSNCYIKTLNIYINQYYFVDFNLTREKLQNTCTSSFLDRCTQMHTGIFY